FEVDVASGPGSSRAGSPRVLRDGGPTAHGGRRSGGNLTVQRLHGAKALSRVSTRPAIRRSKKIQRAVQRVFIRLEELGIPVGPLRAVARLSSRADRANKGLKRQPIQSWQSVPRRRHSSATGKTGHF